MKSLEIHEFSLSFSSEKLGQAQPETTKRLTQTTLRITQTIELPRVTTQG